MRDTGALEEALGHRFQDRGLLELALTHRSFIEERYPGGAAPGHLSQQRLEFLGDAFLGWVLARHLYRRHPEEVQDDLTRRRVRYAKGAWLQARGEDLGLLALLRMGKGARMQVGSNKTVLEDTVEALIGAMVEDGAEDAARDLILRWVEQHAPGEGHFENPIGALQEWLQARHQVELPAGEYSGVGPDHAPRWRCELSLEAWGYGRYSGESTRKKDALRAACLEALRALGVRP